MIKDKAPSPLLWYVVTAAGCVTALVTEQWWWGLIGFFGGLVLVLAWAAVKAFIVVRREQRS